MADEKEPASNEEKEVYEEFPYPKLVKLFDFYFPKTKGHEKINWRKILQAWARWAPWITVLLLILICCFMSQKNIMAGFALFALIASLLNFAYYLVLACFAKFVKRSPKVLLALTPRVPFMCVLVLSIFQLFHLGEPKEFYSDYWKISHEQRVKRDQERREMFAKYSTLGKSPRSTQMEETTDSIPNSEASSP